MVCEPQAVTPSADTASAPATRLQCRRTGFPCSKAIGRFIQGQYEMPGYIAITPPQDGTSRWPLRTGPALDILAVAAEEIRNRKLTRATWCSPAVRVRQYRLGQC